MLPGLNDVILSLVSWKQIRYEHEITAEMADIITLSCKINTGVPELPTYPAAVGLAYTIYAGAHFSLYTGISRQ